MLGNPESSALRRTAIGLVLLVVVVLVALSPFFGRAEPTGSYRPELAPPALETGCYPLPDDLTLAFPHQVRTDGDVTVDGEQRRELTLQYDLVEADEVVESLTASFQDAGFTTVTATDDELTFERSDTGSVTATVTPLEDADEGSIVRGTVVLDLPSVPLSSDDPICDDPYTTKRFPDSYEPAA